MIVLKIFQFFKFAPLQLITPPPKISILRYKNIGGPFAPLKYSKIYDKRTKDKLVRSPGENGGRQDAQKDLHSRTGWDETKGKTQERMER
jgi:hypothetical protein